MAAIATTHHWRTVGLIFVTLALVLPAMMIVSILWHLTGADIVNEDLSNTWMPAFLAFPTRLFGCLLLGAIGTGLAFSGAIRIFEGASIEAASWAVASILGTLTLTLVALVVVVDHDFWRHADTLAQGVGFVVGAFAVASAE